MRNIFGLSIIRLWIAAVVGWAINVAAVFHADFTPLTGEVVLRVIGIFLAPLGSVLGLFF